MWMQVSHVLVFSLYGIVISVPDPLHVVNICSTEFLHAVIPFTDCDSYTSIYIWSNTGPSLEYNMWDIPDQPNE